MRPIIELTIPTSLDNTLAPAGCRASCFIACPISRVAFRRQTCSTAVRTVCTVSEICSSATFSPLRFPFSTYRDASYSYTVDPKLGNWADPKFKREFVQRCFRIVDEYAPNFSRSVIGCANGDGVDQKTQVIFAKVRCAEPTGHRENLWAAEWLHHTHVPRAAPASLQQVSHGTQAWCCSQPPIKLITSLLMDPRFPAVFAGRRQATACIAPRCKASISVAQVSPDLFLFFSPFSSWHDDSLFLFVASAEQLRDTAAA